MSLQFSRAAAVNGCKVFDELPQQATTTATQSLISAPAHFKILCLITNSAIDSVLKKLKQLIHSERTA
ncbi:hypothetical protein LOK49_LG11G00380 [Camellia lanceoleosa]|uniref:Uncharacterized protein n=1 Tax=Camellia lanceoleosa TaxID=1840588 RepID=A0ACC0G1L9_9ERIC|nr:hypothetical protein LOK49_LG11G00380 [Camellia lanceoleosa]